MKAISADWNKWKTECQDLKTKQIKQIKDMNIYESNIQET
jgi:hypothetical protein